jgi:Ca2+-binding RTX toxin-like protein
MSSPINDNFADSIRLIGSSLNTTGTNVNATGEVGEPNHAGVNFGSSSLTDSVWYEWRAPADGTVTINTFGSNYDTSLAVYTGSEVNSLTGVASNDDYLSLQSRVNFSVEAGQTYNIAVDGFGASQGSVNLNLDLDFDYTQLGTNASEQLNGTQGNDVIAGLGGNDQIYGNGGHDYLEGNAGNDTIAGGSLSDYLDGGAGDDVLFGNGGGDEILGGGGNDGLYGSSDADYLDGGAGNDVLYGNGGQDYLLGGGGADTIYGGAQADEILGGDGNDLINGGNGIDEIWLGGGETVVLDANDTGYDIIRNFQLGQTSLAVNDISNLSFADSANGAEIYQGGNLLATVSWQSASTFANNMNNIFVAA